MKKTILIAFLAAFLGLSSNTNLKHNYSHALDYRESHWVDSMYNALSESERVAQLFMIRAHSDKGPEYEQQVENLIRKYKVGGLCFFQGTPERQAELTNIYQGVSDRLPLMISMDAEWGLGMRLKESTISFPKQLMLGAMSDNRGIYEMGLEVARECRRLGVHINFAPDADINNNPANPVINDRSFGEDRYNVAAKSFQYMMGMQDAGVMACAKHFPGHGDTNVDSHEDLPVISHDKDRLDSLELFPFRVLSQFGVGSVMVAHINVPALDSRPNRPTTLSENTVYRLLRKSMGFDGLIFTDAMEMKGVTKFFKAGEADVEALRAGNDIVLLPANLGSAMEATENALKTGTLDAQKIEQSVKRVLRAKYRLGLTKPQRIEVQNVRKSLNSPEALVLKRKLIGQSMTLVRDRAGLVPFAEMQKYRIATLALGADSTTVFQKNCALYAPVRHFQAGKHWSPEFETALLDSLRNYDVVLVSLHDMRSKSADNFGLTNPQINLIRRLSDVKTLCLTVFGNPYSLKYFDHVPVLLEAYNEDPISQELAAQSLFGANDLTGKLPITASHAASFGMGLQVKNAAKRLGYDLPEAVGLNSDTLAELDEIARRMINTGAAPGCQILVAKDGKIVWNKAYGHHSYEKTQPITPETLFDLASITKVAATTISLMKLSDEGKFSLSEFLGNYVPEAKNTDKEYLPMEELLSHHAGLVAWIPFYKKTLEGTFPNRKLYHQQPDHDSQVPVAPGMFLVDNYADTIWKDIFSSELRANKNYRYSDLGLMLGAKALQNISKKPLDTYAEENFYAPMGLTSMMFNPWKRGLAAACAPTEEDRYFRQQRLQGYVHDMGAAMFGGVSGHAGLFSNANDLAKIFQMLLNHGEYGGKRYLSDEVIKRWTLRYFRSTRRGMGFDMKELDASASQNMCEPASANTFGHTGFTGNCVWADPDKNLIFILLSNRTYPTMENNKFISENYRGLCQEVVYRALR